MRHRDLLVQYRQLLEVVPVLESGYMTERANDLHSRVEEHGRGPNYYSFVAMRD